jgi:16S rRNA (uracil1498-N3)-methyltransferase
MAAQFQTWRIFSDTIPDTEQNISIGDDEHHFVRNVLRLRAGETAEIVNGKGAIATAKLVECRKHESIFDIVQRREQEKPPFSILLFVGTPKPSALEELIAVSTELGATQIHLMHTSKVQNKQEIRSDRMRRIMRESMRISRSAWDTEIFLHKSIDDAIRHLPQHSTRVLCDESPIYEQHGNIQNHILSILKRQTQTTTIAVFIGPEASFTNEERTHIATAASAIPVTLGSHILRVPSAAAAATVLCLGFFTTRE